MNIDDERKTAMLRVNGFRGRYDQFGEEYFPWQVALRWQQAVHSDPVDPNRLKEVFDTAKDRRKDFDLVFFAFCNHMECVVRDCWRDSFK